MTGKLSFLPKLKERARSKKVTKSMAIKEGIGLSTIEPVEIPLMMNIQEIQKRLFRLKNSRIGKKILIINAYGV